MLVSGTEEEEMKLNIPNFMGKMDPDPSFSFILMS